MAGPTPLSQPRVSVAGDTHIPRFYQKAVGAAFGVVAAVPLLAPSPAQALTACAFVTGTLSLTDSCTIDDGGNTYAISMVTNSFESEFPSPSTSDMFWWLNSAKSADAATQVGAAFGFPNVDYSLGAMSGPWFAYNIGSPYVGDLRQNNYAYYMTSKYTLAGWHTADGYVPMDTHGYYLNEYRPVVWARSSLVPSGGTSSVPGPLPILGLAAAFGFSRKLRKRIKLHKGTSAVSTPPVA